MKFMKATDQILDQFFSERNSSQSTILNYTRAIKHFETFTGKTLSELLIIAENEEINNISWKNSTLRPLLINYRIYLFEKYMKRTAELYLQSVLTVFISRMPPSALGFSRRGRSSAPQAGNFRPLAGGRRPVQLETQAISMADFVPSRKELNSRGFMPLLMACSSGMP